MSLEDFLILLSRNPLPLCLVLAIPPAASLLVRLLHRKEEAAYKPWKHICAVLIYLAAVPGMFSLVITGYLLIFQHANLLQLNLFICFLPIVAMILTLVIIRKIVSFAAIPGFGRLLGLLILIGVSFAVGILLSKLRIWVVFHGSMAAVLVLSGAVFLLVTLALKLIKGKKL